MTGRITTSELRTRIAETLESVQDQDACIVITRHGHDVAAIVPMAFLEAVIGQFDPGTEVKSFTLPERKSTHPDTDLDALVSSIDAFRAEYGLPPYNYEI